MNKDTIVYLAALSRVHVSDEEMDQLGTDLGSILAFVDQVATVTLPASTEGKFSNRNRMRDDVVRPLESTYNLPDAAPDHQDNFVKVPKVIE